MKFSNSLLNTDRHLLTDGLRKMFGDIDEAVLTALMPMLEWVAIGGGEVLMRQGEVNSDLYLIMSGRLGAYGGKGPGRRFPRPPPTEGPERRLLGVMQRGETIGEVAFFTDAPRAATVIALRELLLARITRPNLESLLQSYPQVTLNMAKLVATRLSQVPQSLRARKPPANICLLPITPDIDVVTLGAHLVERTPREVSALLVTAEIVGIRSGVLDIAQVQSSQTEHYHLLTTTLDDFEANYDAVIYVPDHDLASEWSQRCLRMADRVLLLAAADAPPEIAASLEKYLTGPDKITRAEQMLVLLHPPEAPMPQKTSVWLSRLAVSGHLHIRPHLDHDLARLARTQCGHAVGLVFGGGGARCFAYLGVYKALQEFGIQIDYTGGSSVGAIMAALAALDKPADDIISYARDVFSNNPTGDISLLPVTSLIKGRRFKETIDEMFQNLAGESACIEDLWKTYFCVASNYSQAHEVVLKRGNLAKSIRSSAAIPGLLPPVPIHGDLLVDGGVFNAFPTNVMASAGAAKVIGANISRDLNQPFAHDEIPSNWALINDKITGSHSKYRVPSLMSILVNTATLYSASREQEAESLAHINIKLNLRSIGMLDWHKFDYAVTAGYKQAHKQLSEMSADLLSVYRV